MKKFTQWLTAKNEADTAGVQPMSNQQPGYWQSDVRSSRIQNMQTIAQQASAKLKEVLPLLAQLKTVGGGWERQIGEMEQLVGNLADNLQYMADK